VALSRERERERGKTRAGIVHIFNDITSVENLLVAWREFLRGKRKRRDIAKFSLNLMDNVLAFHRELKGKTYRHGSYHAFKINDPKPRDIHKASVRDRLLHHAIYRVLYPHFDRKFIFDSFSCRREKGVHLALNRFRDYARIVSQNHTRTAWVLKCDVKKFFANINHRILKKILAKAIPDRDTFWLLEQVIDSFNPGLPLGNLTSQLLVNVYMNEFDNFLKRNLKVEYCVRYADDFVILHQNREYLENILPKISEFLQSELKLALHPDKVFIQTFASGIDFLGWVHFPNHRVLRTSTKRRMFNRLNINSSKNSIASYKGLLGHGNTFKLLREFPKEREE
jgi:RNA-directed DNA polymerase